MSLHTIITNESSSIVKVQETCKQLMEVKIPEKILYIYTLSESEVFDTKKVFHLLRNIHKEQIIQIETSFNSLSISRIPRQSSSSDDSSLAEDPGKERTIIEGNDCIISLIKHVKPLLIEAIEDIKRVLLLIELMTPEIADGNNFGVAVQEEVFNEVKSMESQLISELDIFTDYFSQRGKILTKSLKFSIVSDFKEGFIEHDEAFYYKLREIIKELRSYYVKLQDILTKNIEKLLIPRNKENNIISSMY